MQRKTPDFSFIRYANCWEDADLLIDNTYPKKGDRILSIASAGDNSLAFLAYDPSFVLAFDINPTQLFLTELKQKTIKYLSYEESLEFFGFRPADAALREYYFRILRSHLSTEAGAYFENKLYLIQNGIIHQGKFENYFRIFRQRILPLIHGKKRINKLFENKNADSQEQFYREEWNNLRWRLLFRIFFSRLVMGRLGRDPQFFKESKETVGNTIFRRAEKHLRSTSVSGNYFLDYQLRGQFHDNLPFYMRPDNFEKIKQNIDALKCFKGYLTDLPVNNTFDIMNLSNIFEYMNWSLFEKQAAFLSKISHGKSRIAYWNLLVDRSLCSALPAFKENTVQGTDLCFFYDSFHVNSLEL